jgi:integrase
MPKIRTIPQKDGTTHYRFTVDIGRDPDTGKRQQITRTFPLLREAKAELARIGHQTRTGEYVRPWDGTIGELLDAYLRSATFEREANTAASYRHAFLPVRARLGTRLARSIERADIEALRDWMLTAGRRRGGTPGTGLGARSVRLTLGRLKAAFEQACDDGKLYRNPCRGVALPAQARAERATWSEDEARLFLKTAAADRLHAAWRMTLYGMRRGEVLGLTWPDIDLNAKTLQVGRARVLVDCKVIVKAPKSASGVRALPLDDVLVGALRELHKRQAAERLEAGEAYEASGYVVVDELGVPVHPERFTDEFHRPGRRRRVLPNPAARRPAHHQQPHGNGGHPAPHPRRLVRSHRSRQRADLYPRAARGSRLGAGRAQQDLQRRVTVCERKTALRQDQGPRDN